MTRRGSFGHLPRATPDLTSTILAIARQMAAQQESNLIDAWNKGGTYKGEKVTDEMLLKHFRDKMAKLDPSDPLYDTYKNATQQYEYSIGESKAYTQYLQGKLSDQGMANFYLSWAKKIPPDSEFYRTLQQDAAKYIEAGKSRGRAGRAAAGGKSWGDFQNSVYSKSINLSLALEDFMTKAAYEQGIIGRKKDGSPETLRDFALEGWNDPGRMEGLLGSINAGIKSDPAKWAPLVAAIKAMDPNWNGEFTSGYFADTLKSAAAGYEKIAARADALGRTDEAKKARKSAEAVRGKATDVGSWSVGSSYTLDRQAMDAVLNSKTATDADKQAARERMGAVAARLSQSPGISSAQSNRLLNDSFCLVGDPQCQNQPSFYENFLGISSETKTDENSGFRAESARVGYAIEVLKADPTRYVWASSKTDSAGNTVFDPSGEGPVSVVPKSSVSQSGMDITYVPISSSVTGTPIMTAVPINNIVTEDGTVVGKSIAYNVGGRPVTHYRVKINGEDVWTVVNPFKDNVDLVVDPKTGQITLHQQTPAVDLASLATQFDSSHPSGNPVAAAFRNGAVPREGAYWEGGTVADGNGAKWTMTWKGGKLIYDETTYTDGNKSSPGPAPLTAFTAGDPVAQQTTTPPVAGQRTKDDTGNTNTNNLSWSAGGMTFNVNLDSAPSGNSLSDYVDPVTVAAGRNILTQFDTPLMSALVDQQVNGSSMTAIWSDQTFQTALFEQEVAIAGNDLEKLRIIAATDRRIAENAASFGADKHHGLQEFFADRKDRIATIGESVTEAAITQEKFNKRVGGPEIAIGKLIKIPASPQVGPGFGGRGGGVSNSAVTVQQFLDNPAPVPQAPPSAPAFRDQQGGTDFAPKPPTNTFTPKPPPAAPGSKPGSSLPGYFEPLPTTISKSGTGPVAY